MKKESKEKSKQPTIPKNKNIGKSEEAKKESTRDYSCAYRVEAVIGR